MQAKSSVPVRTFSIGFTESTYNEAAAAAQISRHLGTNHTELYVTAEDAQTVIHDLPKIYDEPFADSSQIPTHLVSRLAREHVTVTLSGDGGDELFGGYNRYTWSRNLTRGMKILPLSTRRWMVRQMLAMSPDRLDHIYKKFSKANPLSQKEFRFGEKLHKLGEVFDAQTKEELYWRLVSQWKNPMDALVGSYEPDTILSERAEWPMAPSFTQQMMLLDTLMYLPDDILVKLDRASMAVSLESRVPFLDHKVFEFAWSLPQYLKIRGRQGKWILRKVLERHVPPVLFDRPKMGFGVPIGDWLRGGLREWAEDLLSPHTLEQTGYFKPEVVQHLWQTHIAGRRDQQYKLWPILMFQSWVHGSR
jgi:asparagine synthase (glutamine-hydrolysing)